MISSSPIGLLARTAVLLTLSSSPQLPESPPSSSEAARQSDEVTLLRIVELVKAHDREAIPLLKNTFNATSNAKLRNLAAVYLAQLDDPDGVYFEHVAVSGRRAAEEDVPSPIRVDDSGNQTDGVNEEFDTWCAQKNVTFNECKILIADWVQSLDQLGTLVDPRSRAIFVEAVKGAHPFIVSKSAKGLSILGDTSVLPLLRDAIERQPMDYRAAVAVSLLYFEDEEADAIVKEYVDERMFILFRDAAIAENAKRREEKPWVR